MISIIKNKIGLSLGVICLVLTVFTKEVFTYGISGIMFDLFAYTFFFMYFVLKLKKIIFNKKIVLFVICAFLTSTLSVLYLDLTFFPLIKQLIPIGVFFIVAHHILNKNLINLIEVFQLYIRLAFFSAVFGIIQWILSNFGINILIKEPGLLDSIAYEPSHYAAIIMPAAIYTFYNFKKFKKYFFVFLISLVLTFSFTSYFAFVIAISITNINLKRLPYLVLIAFTIYITLNFLPERILDRVNALIYYSYDPDYFEVETHGSVFSFASNLDVAMYSIKKSPIWGSGLGGHEGMYFKYYKNTSLELHPLYKINYNSAHSLTIRILSELGLLGIFLYILFFLKTYIKRSNNRMLHILWLSCFSHFICKSFKLGGYIDYGTPFFFVFIMVLFAVNKISKLKA